MQNQNILKSKIHKIDGKDYGACQSLLGAYAYDGFRIIMEQIPKDPYAPPHTGIYRAGIPFDFTREPFIEINTSLRKIAFRDFLARRGTGNSGSTSQAAGIIEAIEAGADVLLMDEDTCATNFMIRDKKMQQLVHRDDEPIIAYIDRAHRLFSEKQISTILVLGGTGDYFDVSNKVIQMKQYVPLDVTERAHEISAGTALKRNHEEVHSSI